MIFILACITMVIDHIGLLFFPGEEIYRMIGRISFPLFWWGIVRWYRVTRDKEKYIKRLFFLWILSQIPFLYINMTYNVEIINVIFTLLFWLFAIFIWEAKNLFLYGKIIFIIFLLWFAEYFHFDYGAYGVGMVLLFHIFWQQKMTFIYFLIWTILFYHFDYRNFNFEYHYQIFAPISVIFLYFTSLQKYDFKLPFLVKYLFYPWHFALLIAIYLLIS